MADEILNGADISDPGHKLASARLAPMMLFAAVHVVVFL